MNETTDVHPRRRTGRPFGWILAFLAFPYGPFIYLCRLGALKWPLLAAAIIIAAFVQVGLVSVLGETNHEPWQPWLVLLLGAAMYFAATVQFLIGRHHEVWSVVGLRIWRFFAWMFGVFLLINLGLQVALFHLLNE